MFELSVKLFDLGVKSFELDTTLSLGQLDQTFFIVYNDEEKVDSR